MEKLSLYNITNNFVQLMDKAQEEELTQEEYEKIGEELALQLQQKSGSIIGYAQNEMALIDAVDIQIKRLQDFKKIKQNSLERFKQYVKENMERLELTKIETELGVLSIAKSPMSVEIENEEEVSSEYKTEVVTVKIDKAKIKEDFKSTGEVPSGTRIYTDNTSLRIK